MAEAITSSVIPFELESENCTYFDIDWRFTGFSEEKVFDTPENKRLLDEKEFAFGFTLELIDM